MAHKLGAMYNIPHGIANALLIRQIIKYNATDKPTKQAVFPQYKFPCAKSRYAQIAHALRLGGKDDDENVELLIKAVDDLMTEIQLPKSIKEFGVKEEEFMENLDTLVENSFDDQCTSANPRYPLMTEIRQLFLDAYHGIV